jgi:hypothetical protein
VSLFHRQPRKRYVAAAAAPFIAPGVRPSWPATRLVVLDTGATMIEDRGEVPESLRKALTHHSATSTLEEIARYRGASKREIIRRFVDQQTLPPNTDRGQLTSRIYECTADLIVAYRTVPRIAGAENALRAMRNPAIPSPPLPASLFTATTSRKDVRSRTALLASIPSQEN